MLVTSSNTASLVRQPGFPALRDYVVSATGLGYYREHKDALAGCLTERMAACGVEECDDYLTILRDGTEFDHLVELLSIGETHFFRQQGLFDALKAAIFPEMIRRNAGSRRLRIWSAGCSVGAEAYSLSILLRREFGDLIRGWDVSIVGTDINRQFLARAGRGEFEEWELRGLPDELRASCFCRQEQHWQIHSEYKQGVTFQYHNLAGPTFPSEYQTLCKFDLILCRNVLIYFDTAAVRRIADHAYNSLVDGGWLVVGHAEYSTDTFRRFETCPFPGAVLYRRLDDKGRPIKGAPSPSEPAGFARTKITEVAPRSPSRPATVPHRPGRLLKFQSRRSSSRETLRTTASAVDTDMLKIRKMADGGDVSSALERCKASLSHNHLDPVSHFYHGLLLTQTASHGQAEHALRRAIYLDQNFDLAHYYLGLLQLRQNRQLDAARSFRNVVRLLSRYRPDELLANCDGLTASDLEELAEMHLSTLEQS